MNPHSLRFRQVHLDFHTSGDIPEVGARFDAAAFQQALQQAHVDSVTIFAKCHHGYSYHPTQVGTMHPTLTRDLLGEQIAACRAIGVRCPIYISAGFDEVAAAEHPEWVVVGRGGQSRDLLGPPGWNFMAFGSPYLDYLCAQIEEVVRLWPDNDGIFLDIIGAWPDYSRGTLDAMRARGLNPQSEADGTRHAQDVLREYYRRANASVRCVRKDTPVFHNGGHIPVGAHDFNLANSHFELESLPTGGWGYDHFPLSARYAITQPRDYLGMTGKFHTTWGEFGGFKREAALRYECAAMLANGSKCSVGDQLHPSGQMNPDTYKLIGQAYAEVEIKEPWCREVRAAARIALVSAEGDQESARGHAGTSQADEGASRMLLELHLPFVVLDAQAKWTGFEVVVLPDGFCHSDVSLKKARAHLAGGGRIVAAGSALLTPDRSALALDPGARLLGRSAFDPDYIVATSLSGGVPVRSPIVIGGGALELAVTTGQVLAGRRVPYFNRTWEHFCSHQHTPDSAEAAGPAAVLGNGIACFAHDIFTQYRMSGQPLYRDFVRDALRHLFPNGLPVETSLPTVARFNLLEQPKEQRYIAHLLYAPITLRGTPTLWGKPTPCEIIEELLPLRDTRVSLLLSRPVASATLEPQGSPLAFSQEGQRVNFVVPEFTGHQMVALTHGG